MKLNNLILGLEITEFKGDSSLDLEGLTCDSRKIKKNFLFVAIRGFKEDGHRFIPQAIQRGAKAIVVEREVENLPEGVTLIKVPSSRIALARLSNNFYGFPSREIKLIGVTGTDGKTTTTYLIESILKKAGFKVGRISTIDYSLGDKIYLSSRTTPESVDLERMLRTMVNKHCDYGIIEVSSHSLVLHRVEGVEFDIAVFTNLSRDHLDFHKTMSNYLEAKASLFRNLEKCSKKETPKIAVVNIDDSAGRYIMSNVSCKVVTYGMREKGCIRGKVIKSTPFGISFLLTAPERIEINLSLLGIHNVYNALAATSVALEEGVNLYSIKKGLEEVRGIPGRLEFIENNQNLNIFVDYAHTPEGLRRVLQTLKEVTKGRLMVVFGCGGERDKEKRPLMGEVALMKADYSIITSDNPRSEDPQKIIEEIEEGIKRRGGREGKDYLKIKDRKEAIKKAIQMMKDGDVLLVAGKGHEKVQIFKERVIKFNDREVIQEILNSKGKDERNFFY